MDDLAVCLYPLAAKDAYDDRPLFFYHLEKNGGMGVHMALLAAHHMTRLTAGGDGIYVRFHASDDAAGDHITTIRENPIQSVAYVGKVGIRTYGLHQEFDHPWRLMTLLRDPVDRLVSFYYYQIRRGARPGPASADGFMAFASEPVNLNYQCKMLSALGTDAECDDKDAHDEALANLAGFDWVGRTRDMEEILLGVWSTYGFCPFLSQRLHRNPHKKDTFEHLHDDVRELNRFDMDLFERVSKNPQNPVDVKTEKAGQPINLGPVFAVVMDSDRDDAGHWQIKCAPTESLAEFAQRKGGRLEKLSQLIRPAAAAPAA